MVPELADLHVPEHWTYGAADVALVRLFGRQIQVGNFQVLIEGLAERRGAIGEPAAIGLVRQAPDGRLLRLWRVSTAPGAGHLAGHRGRLRTVWLLPFAAAG